jgi:hypothetical protein
VNFGNVRKANIKLLRVNYVYMKVTKTNTADSGLPGMATRPGVDKDVSIEHRIPSSVARFTIEEIRMRAETMTPVLREILEFRPEPHWQMN